MFVRMMLDSVDLRDVRCLCSCFCLLPSRGVFSPHDHRQFTALRVHSVYNVYYTYWQKRYLRFYVTITDFQPQHVVAKMFCGFLFRLSVLWWSRSVLFGFRPSCHHHHCFAGFSPTFIQPHECWIFGDLLLRSWQLSASVCWRRQLPEPLLWESRDSSWSNDANATSEETFLSQNWSLLIHFLFFGIIASMIFKSR